VNVKILTHCNDYMWEILHKIDTEFLLQTLNYIAYGKNANIRINKEAYYYGKI
jgi:hypothetical protein